jgi:hypothetical protein
MGRDHPLDRRTEEIFYRGACWRLKSSREKDSIDLFLYRILKDLNNYSFDFIPNYQPTKKCTVTADTAAPWPSD